jgi:hypothetical protein
MGKDREKICAHCEGRIAIEADTCLYCGMPLIGDAVSEQDSGGALYPPPYSNKNVAYMNVEKELSKKQVKPAPAAPVAAVAEKREEEVGFATVFLSLLGSTLFILGLMQGFFSENGVLTLEWNCKYWFVFCLAAFPMLYWAAKKKADKN